MRNEPSVTRLAETITAMGVAHQQRAVLAVALARAAYSVEQLHEAITKAEAPPAAS